MPLPGEQHSGLNTPVWGCVGRRDPTVLPDPWSLCRGMAPRVGIGDGGGLRASPWALQPRR